MDSTFVPKALEDATLLDKAGAKVPGDVVMTDQDGRVVHLSDYFGQKKPIVLTLGYYGCPMLCSLLLNGLTDTLKKLGLTPGRDYLLLSASIDPRETPDIAKKKQMAYAESLGLGAQDAWRFHVMAESEAKRLAEVLGFQYYFDTKAKEFAHGAGFFVLSEQGVLARTLFGITFEPSHLKLALNEASEGKIGSFIDKVIMSCFHYNPDSQRYGIYILGVMRLGGLVTVVVVAVMLLLFFRAEKERHRTLG